MSGIDNIKKQISKIKTLIKKKNNQDEKIIQKLLLQVGNIDKKISKLNTMSNKIKGGKLKSQSKK